MRKFLVLGLLGACLAGAEEEVKIDLEARRQSVVTMRDHLERRENRLEEVARDLRERGDEIDQRIGKIVDSLTGLKDSNSSKMRISDLKGQAAKGLMNMIETYQAERRKLVEQAKKDPNAPLDGIAKDVALIDKRVEVRAAQIIKLVGSIPGGKDVKKYENDGGTRYSNGNGWGWENSRISDKWRQSRRDNVQSTKMRREAQKALENSLVDLERRRDTIEGQLKQGQLSEPEREIQKYELNHVKGLLEARRKQLVEVTMPSESSEKPTSKDEADDLKSLFEDARKNLSDDFGATLRLYRQAVQERDKVHALKLNLEAREKWLKENDPDWKD